MHVSATPNQSVCVRDRWGLPD